MSEIYFEAEEIIIGQTTHFSLKFQRKDSTAIKSALLSRANDVLNHFLKTKSKLF